jgi:hypothetical protein
MGHVCQFCLQLGLLSGHVGKVCFQLFVGEVTMANFVSNLTF